MKTEHKFDVLSGQSGTETRRVNRLIAQRIPNVCIGIDRHWSCPHPYCLACHISTFLRHSASVTQKEASGHRAISCHANCAAPEQLSLVQLGVARSRVAGRRACPCRRCRCSPASLASKSIRSRILSNCSSVMLFLLTPHGVSGYG